MMTNTELLEAAQASYQMQHCVVALYGEQPRTAAQRAPCTQGYLMANQLGAQPTKTYRVIAPSDETGFGFGTIIAPDDEVQVYAEGVLLTEPRSGAFIEHADCPVIVLENRLTKHVLAVHAGRPASTPRDGENVITTALDIIARRDEIDALNVYITGSICGAHFRHHHSDIRDKALPFLDEFGPEVFTDIDTYALDLVKVIRWQLMAAGLEEHQITHDGLCTFAATNLTSHRRHWHERRERTTSNLTVVTTY